MANQNKQPIFNNIPNAILWLVMIISVVSLAGLFFPALNNDLLKILALLPSDLEIYQAYRLFTYGLLHGDFAHLGMNMLWLVIFATAVQRNFGTFSLLVIFTVGVFSGGIIFLLLNSNNIIIGASAGVSACCGAALRFMLKPAYDLNGRVELYKLSDGRFLLPSFIIFFIDIVHAIIMSQAGYHIAWQSHIIGYLSGALLMELNLINHGALKRAKLTQSEATYDDN